MGRSARKSRRRRWLLVDVFQTDEYSFKSFGSRPRPEYAVFVAGKDPEAQKYVKILAVSLNSIKQYYDEKYDRGNFIKNVILDNILPGDIYLKSHELHFDSDVSRVCMLVKIAEKNDISAYDVLQNLFPDKNKDFIININETDIALVKEIKPNIDEKDIDKLASSIVDTLSGEFYTHCTVGIGTVVNSIKDLARSFKEAQVALEVGKVFDTEKRHRQLQPPGHCPPDLPAAHHAVRDVPEGGVPQGLHRFPGPRDAVYHPALLREQPERLRDVPQAVRPPEHLVYRLEKIKKITGLDLREFEDAIVFKVALMVKKYLSSNPMKF